MSDQPKDPQNQSNDTPNPANPQDDSGLIVPAGDSTPAAPVSEEDKEAAEAAAFYAKMFAADEEQPEETAESVTAKNAETKEGIQMLQGIYLNAEKAYEKANKNLEDIRKQAADSIAAIEKDVAVKSKEAITAFASQVAPVVTAYENTLAEIPADARADQRFDKIVKNFELNLNNLKNVFNKYSVKPEASAPVAAASAPEAEAAVNNGNTAAAPDAETPAQESAPAAKTLAELRAESVALENDRLQLLQDIEKKQLSTQQVNINAQNVKESVPSAIETARRQQEAKLAYAITPVVKDLLPVIDTYESGIKSLAADMDTDTPVGKLLVSIKGHFDMLTSIFNTHGVQVIAPKPHDDFHELQHAAWKSEPEEGFGDGVVVELKQKGYMLKDRVIRAAGVFTTPE